MNHNDWKIETMSKHFLMKKTHLQQCVNSVCSRFKITTEEVLNVLGKNNLKIEMKRVLIPDILNIIEEYTGPLKYKLRFPELFKKYELWIDDLKTEKEIKNFWRALSSNPKAITMLEQNPHEIDWRALSSNPNAIHLLEKKLDKIDWEALNANPNGIELLKKNPSKINWSILCRNPGAGDFIEESMKRKKLYNKIDWASLSSNPSAIKILESNQHKIFWRELSSNPNAIELLEKNIQQIHWFEFSSNPNAIEILKENRDQINWNELSRNPNGIELLKTRPDQINWSYLIQNPDAIELIKEKKKIPYWSEFFLNPNPDVVEFLLKKYLKFGKKTRDEIITNLWSNPAIFEDEKNILSELMKDEKYYVVYNNITGKEEKTFNTLEDAQEYAIFFI